MKPKASPATDERTQEPPPPPHPLIGHYFHSFTGAMRVVQWQGQITAVTETGVLVQLYEWFAGAPSVQRWCPLAAVEDWDLYDSIEEMASAYEHKHRARCERFASNET